jgi:hypothetical protein
MTWVMAHVNKSSPNLKFNFKFIELIFNLAWIRLCIEELICKIIVLTCRERGLITGLLGLGLIKKSFSCPLEESLSC